MNKLKIAGIITSVVSIGANLVATMISEKKQETIIDTKVKEALAKQLKDRA